MSGITKAGILAHHCLWTIKITLTKAMKIAVFSADIPLGAVYAFVAGSARPNVGNIGSIEH
jgi:hypothetical protein